MAGIWWSQNARTRPSLKGVLNNTLAARLKNLPTKTAALARRVPEQGMLVGRTCLVEQRAGFCPKHSGSKKGKRDEAIDFTSRPMLFRDWEDAVFLAVQAIVSGIPQSGIVHGFVESNKEKSDGLVTKEMASIERCQVRFRDVEFFSPLAEDKYEQMVREMKDLTADVRHVHWLNAYIPECINGTTQLSVWRLARELLLLLGYEELPGMHILANRYVTQDTVIPDWFIEQGVEYEFGPQGDDAGSIAKHRDVYLMRGLIPEIRMIVHPDRLERRAFAEARLVEKVIQAFTENQERARRRGEELKKQVFLGLLVLDTSPVFYRIPVTRRLAACMQKVTRRMEVETVVERFDPGFPRDAMGDPIYREKIAHYLLGFKRLLASNEVEVVHA
ncbi:hypothetical protein SELMODRAFT_426435 [Selaginella moellendorffii]|uniref:Uncharacterized protein n=1 Tax=Selaginella moellendorffii TaxID=88036 RepID=D8SWC7_SELML|nr:hypothetical protein SELMODRAFT_426435 [Selaginella moellendorffii]